MAEFLAEALEQELNTGIKELVMISLNNHFTSFLQFLTMFIMDLTLIVECMYLFIQGVFFQDRSLFSSFLATSTMEIKIDKKSRSSVCFLELPHFPQAFRSDVDQLQVS